MLHDPTVPLEDKELFTELLINLYLRYYRLPPVPSDLMPHVLQLDTNPKQTAYLVDQEA